MASLCTTPSPESLRAARSTFWWDRAGRRRAEVPDLQAAIFSLDAALADGRHDDAVLSDLVWDLHCSGVRIAVVTQRRGSAVQRSVRDLLGDGAVEVLVTGDEVTRPKPDPEVYRHALWQLGVRAADAMAVEDSAVGLRAAVAAGLATAVITPGRSAGDDFSSAAAVLSGWEASERLSVQGCRRMLLGSPRLTA